MSDKQGVQVPYSAGSALPQLSAPAAACDCHMHIFDPRFPASPHWTRGAPNAPVDAYRLLQKRIGTTRCVVVNPSTYGTDNRCTLDALAAFGASARGVAVVDKDVDDEQLQRLAVAGVCGIRINFVSPQSWGKTKPEMLTTLSARVAGLGWHVQVFALSDQIVAMEKVLEHLPTPLVIDHLGRIPQPAGICHPAFRVVCRLLERGNTWIKLSGAYMDTKTGPPGYSDLRDVAQGYVRTAPEKCIWGSDWPHTTASEKPDDATLFDLLAEWAPDEATRHRILVENAQVLYGFAQTQAVTTR